MNTQPTNGTIFFEKGGQSYIFFQSAYWKLPPTGLPTRVNQGELPELMTAEQYRDSLAQVATPEVKQEEPKQEEPKPLPPLAVGQTWRQRNGEIITIVESDGSSIPFKDSHNVWRRTHRSGTSDCYDLIELIEDAPKQEEPATPEVKQDKIVPLHIRVGQFFLTRDLAGDEGMGLVLSRQEDGTFTVVFCAKNPLQAAVTSTVDFSGKATHRLSADEPHPHDLLEYFGEIPPFRMEADDLNPTSDWFDPRSAIRRYRTKDCGPFLPLENSEPVAQLTNGSLVWFRTSDDKPWSVGIFLYFCCDDERCAIRDLCDKHENNTVYLNTENVRVKQYRKYRTPKWGELWMKRDGVAVGINLRTYRFVDGPCEDLVSCEGEALSIPNTVKSIARFAKLTDAMNALVDIGERYGIVMAEEPLPYTICPLVVLDFPKER